MPARSACGWWSAGFLPRRSAIALERSVSTSTLPACSSCASVSSWYPTRSSRRSSWSSMPPEESGSHSSKRESISAGGASNCSCAIARWNSARVTVRLPSSSHSRKSSTTLTA